MQERKLYLRQKNALPQSKEHDTTKTLVVIHLKVDRIRIYLTFSENFSFHPRNTNFFLAFQLTNFLHSEPIHPRADVGVIREVLNGSDSSNDWTLVIDIFIANSLDFVCIDSLNRKKIFFEK